MIAKILTSPILYWTFTVLGGIGCLMFLTLVISMFVKEDGLIVINRSSTFYRIRFLTMLPWSTLHGFRKHNGSTAYAKHPTKDWGERCWCPYIKRVIIDAHYYASRETSLCGLFWSHLLSTTVLLPFVIIGLAAATPLLIIGFILFGIGFGFYFVGKNVAVHLGAFGKWIIEMHEKFNERQLEKHKLKYEELLKGKVGKEIKIDMTKIRKRIRENNSEYASQEQKAVEAFFKDIKDGIIPRVSAYSVREIVDRLIENSEKVVQDLLRETFYYGNIGNKIKKDKLEIIIGLFIDSEFSKKALSDLDSLRKRAELREFKEKIKAEKRKKRAENWDMLKAVWNKTMCPTIKFVDNSVKLDKK